MLKLHSRSVWIPAFARMTVLLLTTWNACNDMPATTQGTTNMTSLDTLIANTIREDVRAGHGYNVPDASGYVKLDAMENPYELPEQLRRELATRLADAVLNRYPVASYTSLKQKICAKL